MPLVHIGSALLYALAGFCLFLMLTNRVLMLMPDSRAKTPLMLASFFALSGIGAVLGFFLARPPWVYVPLAILVLILIGEARRSLIRRSFAGSSPVDTVPHQFNLAAPVTTTDLVVHRYRLPHQKWRGTPFRVVHLTDLHVDAGISPEYYREVVTIAEQSGPDIAVFTGDFIDSAEALPELAKILRPIAKLETYAVLGNHDYWTDADAVREVITGSGLHLLSDETVLLARDEDQVAITGYDYPWGTKEKSVSPHGDATLHVVLTHTPDNIYRLSRSSADVVFAGHCHAGQFRIPVVGPIAVPSAYGRRFDHGHFVVNGTHLFVAGGIGAAGLPVRIYCQPDIFVVDITQ